jgi:hypothetical protein
LRRLAPLLYTSLFRHTTLGHPGIMCWSRSEPRKSTPIRAKAFPSSNRSHHGDDAATPGRRDTGIRGLRRGTIRYAFVGRCAYASADQSPSNGVRGSRQAVEATRRGNDYTTNAGSGRLPRSWSRGGRSPIHRTRHSERAPGLSWLVGEALSTVSARDSRVCSGLIMPEARQATGASSNSERYPIVAVAVAPTGRTDHRSLSNRVSGRRPALHYSAVNPDTYIEQPSAEGSHPRMATTEPFGAYAHLCLALRVCGDRGVGWV